ncbi:hypothetical protein PILCRDRAFT_2971 [Piloderma croceum F 1598]|uniref:Uncharacterized protein n=1 Tax=Piloderma croceum (strain F 1598) TaxID=765440 RepID=A0A0C3GAL9_PILCF|nr:hypothetical protein PILCRDRAFT_2971 [Piloderma croceum F 1598]
MPAMQSLARAVFHLPVSQSPLAPTLVRIPPACDAEELLKCESSLMTVLQRGLSDRSFKDVRRLVFLCTIIFINVATNLLELPAGYKSAPREASGNLKRSVLAWHKYPSTFAFNNNRESLDYPVS